MTKSFPSIVAVALGGVFGALVLRAAFHEPKKVKRATKAKPEPTFEKHVLPSVSATYKLRGVTRSHAMMDEYARQGDDLSRMFKQMQANCVDEHFPQPRVNIEESMWDDMIAEPAVEKLEVRREYVPTEEVERCLT